MIPKYLTEAYCGYLEKYLRAEYTAYTNTQIAADKGPVEDYASWAAARVSWLIQIDSPKRRLEIYCAWKGIVGGISDILYDIATSNEDLFS